VLGTPEHVVRLAGSSGVGKTRLAEALFDSSVGEGALDPFLAIYTNIADVMQLPPVQTNEHASANPSASNSVFSNLQG